MKWLEWLTRVSFFVASCIAAVVLYWLAALHAYFPLIFLTPCFCFLLFGGYVTGRTFLWWWQFGESGHSWRELPWFIKVSSNFWSPRDWFS